LTKRPRGLATDRALQAGPASTPTFASAVGISRRTLHRVSLRTFGFAPKRLLRRQGFTNVLGHSRVKRDRTLDTHVDDEYFDPSNFLRDFAIFAGMTTRTCLRAARVLKQKPAAARARRAVSGLLVDRPPHTSSVLAEDVQEQPGRHRVHGPQYAGEAGKARTLRFTRHRIRV
jgi:methylphosphotriester-DNA--protein-cysteine methyltransferase